MKKIRITCVALIAIFATHSADAFLDTSRSLQPCSMRDSKLCKDPTVFLRDVKDNCVLIKGETSNCLRTFCSSNCATGQPLPEGAIAQTCNDHCLTVDLLNHKLQNLLKASIPDAWNEADVKTQITDQNALNQRNAKEKANYDSRYSVIIAQLTKAAHDDLRDRREALDLKRRARLAEKKSVESKKHYHRTLKAARLELSDLEIRGLLNDYLDNIAKHDQAVIAEDDARSDDDRQAAKADQTDLQPEIDLNTVTADTPAL